MRAVGPSYERTDWVTKRLGRVRPMDVPNFAVDSCCVRIPCKKDINNLTPEQQKKYIMEG